MLLHDLGQGSVVEEPCILGSKDGSKIAREDVLYIKLGVGRECVEPNTERLTITDRLGWRNIKRPTLHGSNNTGVPKEKGSTVGIDREILLPVLGSALIKSTGSK
jgi:hypothetical protein